MKTIRLTEKFSVSTITTLLLFILPVLSFGQVSGIKYIPGNYLTIAAAIADLNTNGVGAGGVTINITGGATETAPSTGYILTATGTAANPIVIQKEIGRAHV